MVTLAEQRINEAAEVLNAADILRAQFTQGVESRRGPQRIRYTSTLSTITAQVIEFYDLCATCIEYIPNTSVTALLEATNNVGQVYRRIYEDSIGDENQIVEEAYQACQQLLEYYPIVLAASFRLNGIDKSLLSYRSLESSLSSLHTTVNELRQSVQNEIDSLGKKIAEYDELVDSIKRYFDGTTTNEQPKLWVLVSLIAFIVASLLGVNVFWLMQAYGCCGMVAPVTSSDLTVYGSKVVINLILLTSGTVTFKLFRNYLYYRTATEQKVAFVSSLRPLLMMAKDDQERKMVLDHALSTILRIHVMSDGVSPQISNQFDIAQLLRLVSDRTKVQTG